MIRQINKDNPTDQLRSQLIENKIEVGMVEFTMKEDVLRLPDNYNKIGNFELDIIAIDINSEAIVMLDHDKPDFVMGFAAKDLKCFVGALIPIEEFFEASMDDDDLFDDEDAMNAVTSKASKLAGGEEYLWFYNMIFGI